MMSFYYNIKIPQQIMQEETVQKLGKEKYTDEFAKQFTINHAVAPLLASYLGNKNTPLIGGVNTNFINHDKATISDTNVNSLSQAYQKAQQLQLPLLTAHSGHNDITEQVTLNMLKKHFDLYKQTADLSPRQRITSALIEQWGDLMNKSRSVLTQKNYFINNNAQRFNLFSMFWRYAPSKNTLSSSKLASEFLLQATNDWRDLIIMSNYYRRSVNQQKS